MKVKIYYNGKLDDDITFEGKDLKEISKKVEQEIKKRNWKPENCWSEIIEE